MAGEAASDGRNNDANMSKLTAGLLGLLTVGLLLALMGFTFASSAVLLVASLPLLLLFSPMVVPTAVTVATVVLAFGVSGAMGLGGFLALKWAMGRLRSIGGDRPGGADQVGHLRSRDGGQSGWPRPVGRALTESGHVVTEQEREVGGYWQRVVQVKGE